MVFQSYALFPQPDGARQRRLWAENAQRMPRADSAARVDELLDMMRLTAHADKPIDQLSGGQRQRVALARALAVRAARAAARRTAHRARREFARSTAREMNALLRRLGITTVYVTHDQAEAMALGDRIVVMSAGRIEQIGSPRDIYYRPANRTVAQFVGTINRVAGERRGNMLTTTGGAVPLPSTHTQIATPARSAHEIFFRPEDAFSPIRQRATARPCRNKRVSRRAHAPDDQRRRTGCVAVDVAGRVELARGTPVGISIVQDALIALS